MNLQSKRHVIEALKKEQDKTKVGEMRDTLPTWCPGCGHFTALHGLYEAVNNLNIAEKDFVVVSGIGCSGRFPFFIKGFGFHAVHGRAIPVATGIKIANPNLKVIVVGGDGDGVGIGGGHFPHAARNNIDLTYLLLDNSIYGLTKGQVSPTSPIGMLSATTPYGNISRPINPSTLGLAYGATYVARTFSKERTYTSEIITDAIAHKGFSFVHVLSPCVEFNKLITYKSIDPHIKHLGEDYKSDNRAKAMELSESNDPIYTGILIKENVPTYLDRANEIINKLQQS